MTFVQELRTLLMTLLRRPYLLSYVASSVGSKTLDRNLSDRSNNDFCNLDQKKTPTVVGSYGGQATSTAMTTVARRSRVTCREVSLHCEAGLR